MMKAGEGMLKEAVERTNQYMNEMPKTERKKYGQFFTSMETARFMAGLYQISGNYKKISILDAGAGSGILSCALLERLEQIETIQEIELTCYENNRSVFQLLKDNLQFCRSSSRKKIIFDIKMENYIINQYQNFKKYDLVIGNPPYKKISKDAPEAAAMPEVCYGTPNLYFLFAAMGLFHLKKKGEMVYIIPRSWTSGAYFKKFRQYFLTEGKLEWIHLFVSRNKVFDREEVLQETMIIKVKKTEKMPSMVMVTCSQSNCDFESLTSFTVPYSLVVSGEQFYVYLPTNEKEVSVLKRLNQFRFTLPEIGVKMKTGLTVDFRNRESLHNEMVEGAVPLFYPQHIKQGRIQFPLQKKQEYILTEQKGLLQDNRNYLFIKRFTAKEEQRRLQCGIYLAKTYPQYKKISTQNKINFIDGLEFGISECLVYGLYVLFQSTFYDIYYRVLNGSTQVNSTEVNTMPVPDIRSIEEMGKELMKSEDLSERNCDRILEVYCG